ncbi:ABC transporter permease [Aestuariimicrobium sp. p3-SID1156]|uniref:ABC transporter permease n=1 Tax=Aestuariimicrobium sp. p3-SID1156 TaxID=2916038 RepID=UPI00223AA9C9|nr:ABC transporter permease [Aestuariimicrobium sp. p3-SID1156]MCT1459321.1 ABC transporter permease [Aestuariimicrobium sp. p3-SID1156]
MITFLIRRILILVPMALLISMLIFFAIRLSPVDPILYMVPPDAANDPANLERLRESLGLNAPLPIQYLRWLGNMVTGDFGYSISSGQRISDILALRLPATLELVGLAMLLSTTIALSLGLFAGAKPGGIADKLARTIAVIGIAVPDFFFGIALLQIFSYRLGWLPAGGRMLPGQITFLDRLPQLVLPVAALTFGMLAVLIRYTRNSVLDTMGKEFVKTARSKGVPEWKVLYGHVFRNSLGPVMVILAFRLPLLVGGSVLIETIFRWPGIGHTVVSAVSSSDYPVIMVTSMLIALMILFASFLIDVVKSILDPRVRLS